ncbi:RNA polymerase sigma factor [Neobacillus sedimentimangrovi]|jgi:RNA polymerase sigma factor (sigma-70 family)|uniref:RNA polymerase sigma factor n=1 Tax=Neobacillus sedimentimangrovi TaxID=2699460 RepID=UPI0009DDBE4E|nr:sigma-70 family RNA polymerase sigma factor [Neobacillus sedimentimangrovi]
MMDKRGGDVKAAEFNQLYTKYAKRLLYIAYKYTKDLHQAEDIVQESFLKAYKKIHTIEDKTKLGGWLSAITARTAIDFLRLDKRRNWFLIDDSMLEPLMGGNVYEISTEETVHLRLFKETISDSLKNLSKEFQEVLVLKIQYGLKENEIASLLDMKSATVKTRLYRARKQLKQLVGA